MVDVRDASEYDKSTIPGASNIPVDELADRIGELRSDKLVVFICATGARSGEAYDIVKLENKQAQVFFLNAEVSYKGEGVYTLAAN